MDNGTGGGDYTDKAHQVKFQESFEIEPSSRIHHFKKVEKTNCFLAIFATRQLASNGNRELYIKYSVRELCIYILYLTCLCTMIFVDRSSSTYFYTKALTDLFINKQVTRESDVDADNTKTFETSSDVRDFWNYVEGPMLEGLYWENWYGAAGADEKNTKNLFVQNLLDQEKKYGILYENRLMGSAALRQIRVVSEACPIGDNYRQLHRECFPDYAEWYEDQGGNNSFWTDHPQQGNKEVVSAWRYERGSRGNYHLGRLAWYSDGGGRVRLSSSYATSKQRVNQLRQNLWINRATRAIFLDFTVYNANINLFCVVKLVWEFSGTGGVLTSHSLRTVKLIRYQTWEEINIVLPSEIFFILFTLYYIIQETVEICHLRCRNYFSDPWSWLDITIYLVSCLCIGFSIYRYYLVKWTLESLTVESEEFHDFQFLGYWETQFNNVVSICLFISWVKVFKYISFNKTMTQLSSTLSRCAKDIGGFAIMFFIIFFAFAQLGYLLFGSQIEDFHTFTDSIFTLLRLILGDFDFRQIESANRILGPIYFLAYVFFVFFVLLNMFLAIINDTYSEVKAEIQSQSNEFEIADYFKRIGNRVKGRFGKRSTKLDAEASIKLAAADGQISYEELKSNLKNGSFSETEIEMFLSRFDLDQNRGLDEEEAKQVLDDLEEGQIVVDESSEKSGGNYSGRRVSLFSQAAMRRQSTVSRRLTLAQFNNNYNNIQTKIGGLSDSLLQNEEINSLQNKMELIETALSEFLHKTQEMCSRVEARSIQKSKESLEDE